MRKALSEAPVLRQIDENLTFILRTDASSYAIGAILLQGESLHEERPIEYASRLLTTAEVNYSTTERKALAVVLALKKFHGYIDGSKVLVATDHQPLKWLMTLKSTTGRLARWALQIQQFGLQITYTPGKSNFVADLLSRPFPEEDLVKCPVATATVTLPFRTAVEIREEQLTDDALVNIINVLEDPSLDAVDYSRFTGRGYLLDKGVLYRFVPERDSEEPQLVVPKISQPRILEEYHNTPTSGHYGVGRRSKEYQVDIIGLE